MDRNFRIDGNIIDYGKGGRFGPGNEQRLRNYLKSLPNGQKDFDNLVKRKLIVIDEPKPAKQDNSQIDQVNSFDTKDNSDNEETDDVGTQYEYEATGEYYFDHYGGGNCNIVDPDGNVVDQVYTKKAASERVEQLNSE